MDPNVMQRLRANGHYHTPERPANAGPGQVVLESPFALFAASLPPITPAKTLHVQTYNELCPHVSPPPPTFASPAIHKKLNSTEKKAEVVTEPPPPNQNVESNAMPSTAADATSGPAQAATEEVSEAPEEDMEEAPSSAAPEPKTASQGKGEGISSAHRQAPLQVESPRVVRRRCLNFDGSTRLASARNAAAQAAAAAPPPSMTPARRRASTFNINFKAGEDSGDDDDLSPGPPSKERKRNQGNSGSCKRCNCKKSKCLKLYCECFAAGIFCNSCFCQNCLNTPENKGLVQQTRAQIEARNPLAFAPKIVGTPASAAEDMDTPARHKKGCHCKKSHCLKKYCECYQAGVKCTEACKCENCHNNLPCGEDHEGGAAAGVGAATTKLDSVDLAAAFGDAAKHHSELSPVTPGVNGVAGVAAGGASIKKGTRSATAMAPPRFTSPAPKGLRSSGVGAGHLPQGGLHSPLPLKTPDIGGSLDASILFI